MYVRSRRSDFAWTGRFEFGSNRIDRPGLCSGVLSKQLSQNVIDDRFTFISGQIEDLQVILGRGILATTVSQRIVSHAKIACWEEVFTIAVVLERAWLANQPVNDVAIIHLVLTSTAKPWKAIDLFLSVPNFQVIGVNAHVNMLAD